MSDPSDQLSAAGVQRREAILRATLGVVRARRSRRRAVRLGAGAGAVALVALIAVVSRQPSPSRPGGPAPGPKSPSDASLIVVVPSKPTGEFVRLIDDAGPNIPIIPADPTIAARLAVPAALPTWQAIDDEQFLSALAAAGEPAGLVRINGQTIVVAHQ